MILSDGFKHAHASGSATSMKNSGHVFQVPCRTQLLILVSHCLIRDWAMIIHIPTNKADTSFTVPGRPLSCVRAAAQYSTSDVNEIFTSNKYLEIVLSDCPLK